MPGEPDTNHSQHVPKGARAAAREAAILDAALELLLEVGYENLSIDAIAERARAGKATIYRHFPNKAAIVVSAIGCHAAEFTVVDTGSLRGDLLAFGRGAMKAAGLDERLFAGLLNASRSDEVLAEMMNERMWESKQTALRTVVERAVLRGELANAERVPLLCEVTSALVLHRLFVERAEPDEAFRVHLVDDIVIPLLTHREQPTASGASRARRGQGLATTKTGTAHHPRADSPSPQLPTPKSLGRPAARATGPRDDEGLTPKKTRTSK